jgi:serine/threonine protein kinase
LGVCLYEFLTGITPFNDETPQKVFENILSLSKLIKLLKKCHLFSTSSDIEWPVDEEELSEEAVEAVQAMLTVDAKSRPCAEDCKSMKFFESINFDDIQNMEPPFRPEIDDPHDTGYFQARNEMQHLHLSNFELS